MSGAQEQKSFRKGPISLSLPRPKDIKNFIKPLSIRNFTSSKIFKKQLPEQTMDYMYMDEDTEKNLLGTAGSAKLTLDESTKKLTRFQARRKSVLKSAMKIKPSFFCGLKNIFESIYKKLDLLIHSVLYGMAMFINDLVRGFRMILITITKCLLIAVTKVILWKESKWPSENSPRKKRSNSLNNTLFRKWRKFGRLDTKPLTLVLDLDETLIHATMTAKLQKNYEPILMIQNDGAYRQIYLKRRPHLNLFLEKISHEYNVVIFTASKMEYADPIIDVIDQASHISKRLYRDSCVRVGQGWVKDIRKVGSDLTRTLLIDNCIIAGNLHPDNHLLIKPWFDDEKDEELLRFMESLLDYAKKWKANVCKEIVKDIREFVKRDVSLQKLKEGQLKGK